MDERQVCKAFRPRRDGSLGFLFHGHEGSRTVPRGTWLRARARWVRNGRGRKYRAGFHCFLTLDAAAAFIYATRGKYPVYRVNVRTVLLCSWLRWVLTDQHRAEVFWGAAVLAFPLALGRWFSLLGLYEDMAWLLFGALVLIAIQAVQDWSRERNKNRPEEPEKPREPKRPSPFHALVVAYIRSFHERICPLIEITD